MTIQQVIKSQTLGGFRTNLFILNYFNSMVKQALFAIYKSRLNPFLQPTSTKQ